MSENKILSDDVLAYSDYYNGSPCFLERIIDSKKYFSSLLIAGEFGIPMKGPIDWSQNSTGWLAPGKEKKLILHYSIPSYSKIERLKMERIEDIFLEPQTD